MKFTIEAYKEQVQAIERRTDILFDASYPLHEITGVEYMPGKEFIEKLNKGEIDVWEK